MALIAAAARLGGAHAREVQATAIIVLGVDTALLAGRLQVFPHNEGERRYATIAQLVQQDWERPIFEQRFAAMNSHGRLSMAPVLAYRAHQISGTVYLFDPSGPDAATLEPAATDSSAARSVPGDSAGVGPGTSQANF